MSNVPVGLLHNGQCRVGRFTDSDDEWCLICLIHFNDLMSIASVKHSKLTHGTYLAIITTKATLVRASNTIDPMT